MLKHCEIKRHGAVKATLHAFLILIRDRSQYPPLLSDTINLLKPTGYVMDRQFNIQQLYALPKLY